MTNLLNLPQFPAGTTVEIATNCDWLDTIFVALQGYGSDAISITGQLNTSPPHISGLTTPPPVVPGMIAAGPGIPSDATVASATSSSITLSDGPTFSAPAATVSFLPPPMDLTGISFSSEIRLSIASPWVVFSASTAAGTMTNGGSDGVFGWNVPGSALAAAPFPSSLLTQGSIACVMDVIATDATGAKVNLCAANGPIPVTLSLSITR